MADELLYRATLAIAIGGIAALEAYRLYPEIGILSALVVLFAISWFLFRFSAPQLIWNTLGFLKKPPIAGFMFFLAVFLYFSYKGLPFGMSSFLALGMAFVGAAIGILLFKYWTIGD